jgi:hypothetical protein
MEEIKKEFFITHIGKVTVNNYGAVEFETQIPPKVLMSANTLNEINREVKYYIKEMRMEGTYRR